MTVKDDNKITNADLYNKKYSIDELETNVFNLIVKFCF